MLSTDEKNEFLTAFADLRTASIRGQPAPYKPILLLVLLELADRNELPTVVPLSPELAFRFYAYCQIPATKRGLQPDIRYPFYHLFGDGFWQPMNSVGEPATGPRDAANATLSPRLYALMGDDAFRLAAKEILIARYFSPDEQAALCALTDVPLHSLTAGREFLHRDAQTREMKPGRDARFRIDVVAAYNYTCALTGYRLLTVAGSAIVDAAHIHAFSDSQSNDPRNGIALSKNAHWAFDEGLWTITEQWQVKVARGIFDEHHPGGLGLRAYDGQQLRLPVDKALWPNEQFLRWHRENRFEQV